MPGVLAAVMPAPEAPVEVREFPEPALPRGAALLAPVLSEVCGTDVHLWHGRLEGVPYPIIPGHVSVGTIEKLRGRIVTIDDRELAEGDLVVFFDVHRTCNRCHACTVARTPTRCPSRRVYGITDPAEEGLFGGWAQRLYLEPGVALLHLPPSIDPADYIGGGCGLITAAHILERSGLRAGESLVVQGTGAVGLSVIALARTSGAATIIAIGAPSDRLALARRMGADAAFDLGATTRASRAESIREATGGHGADIVVEAAGAAAAVEEGFDLARNGGMYVIAGHYTDQGVSRINAHTQINRKHLDVRGCWGSEVRHLVRALTMLERSASILPWREIGRARYGLDELNRALADAEAMRVPKALVDPQRMTVARRPNEARA
jgi:L-iditol 2-dehydrogenase